MGFVIALICLVAVVGATTNIKEDRGHWALTDVARGDEVVGLYFALKQRNLEEFDRRVVSITSPRSANYTKYMSKDEILDLIAPPAHVPEGFVRWIRSTCNGHELVKVDNRRDTIRVEARARCIERLLKIRLARYTHTKRAATVVRIHRQSPSPTVPAYLKSHLDLIEGLHMLPVLRHKKQRKNISKPLTPAATYGYVDIGAINRVYNIASNKVVSPKATQSVIEFAPEGAPLLSDLQQFDQLSGIPFSNVSQIVGPWSPGDDGESLLDIQLITAVAQTPTAYITIPDGWVYAMAQEIYSMANPPLVNSVSYGWPTLLSCQSDVTNSHCNEDQDPHAYVLKSELELKKTVARGISWSVCSQDEGAPSEANMYCSLDSSQPVWSMYPGGSAYVTSVSATTIVSNNNNNVESNKVHAVPAATPICQQGYQCTTGTAEESCSVQNTYYDWTTGGGFCDYVPTPTWQKTLVQQYLKQNVPFPPTGKFNAEGRVYPDVAATGSRILVVSNGAVSVSAGTSASTPIIAGIMTLVNDVRLRANKAQIGFWNPALYDMYDNCPQCFNVIPAGNNNKCTIGSPTSCCSYGYYVQKGHGTNAVTGLGTLNVREVIAYMTKLP